MAQSGDKPVDLVAAFKEAVATAFKCGDYETLERRIQNMGDLPKSLLSEHLGDAIDQERVGAVRLLLQYGVKVEPGHRLTRVVMKDRLELFKMLSGGAVDFPALAFNFSNDDTGRQQRALYLKKVENMRKELENEKLRAQLTELKDELVGIKLAMPPDGNNPHLKM